MSLFRLVHASDLHFSRVAHKIGIPDILHAWATHTPGTSAPVSSQGDIYVDAFAAWVEAKRSWLPGNKQIGFFVVCKVGSRRAFVYPL